MSSAGGPDPAQPPEPLRVGWKEYLDLPDWGLRRLRVKMDTGARTSALDSDGYQLVQENGTLSVRLRLTRDRRRNRVLEVTAPVVRMAVVRSTSGQAQRRPVVCTTIRLGPVRKQIEVTIADRHPMRHRMILGREALAGTFVVDCGRMYLLSRPPGKRRDH
jgi:hypothetical protein